MLTDRDKSVLRFIERHRAISTQQAMKIFFEGCKRSAIRRLNQLEELKILESYTLGKEKIYKYPEGKELSRHDLYILDFIAFIYENGGELLDYHKTPRYFKGLIIPDALLKFNIKYCDDTYTCYVLLEIDYTHYTENTKLNTWYEKLYREEVLKEYCGSAEFPFVVIARPTTGLRYNSKNFNIVYTDLKFTNILQLMLE